MAWIKSRYNLLSVLWTCHQHMQSVLYPFITGIMISEITKAGLFFKIFHQTEARSPKIVITSDFRLPSSVFRLPNYSLKPTTVISST